MGIQDSGFMNKDGTEIGIDPPIQVLIGNRNAGDIASYAQMVQFFLSGT